jgi:hypothetical protein
MNCIDVVISVVVGIVTGGASSWYVSRKFYFQGRFDVEDSHKLLELDEVEMRFAALDPFRHESRRGSDGVDDTAHWLDCRAAIMQSNNFPEGAKLLHEHASRLRERLKKGIEHIGSTIVNHTNEEAEQEKLMYSEEIRSMRCLISRRTTTTNSLKSILRFAQIKDITNNKQINQ